MAQGIAGGTLDLQCMGALVLPQLRQNQQGKKRSGGAHESLEMEGALSYLYCQPQKEQNACLERPPAFADVVALLVEKFQRGERSFGFALTEGPFCGADRLQKLFLLPGNRDVSA
ncbi:MAG: hypothetical protein HFI29_08850 [Lachnospiraceae bacterium]|nr:hypothetical protein [Lachnospiraceae bacterium]